MWFRLANHSPGCIRRREVLVSPRGPLFLASRITMVGNSGVPKTFCQTPRWGQPGSGLRDQDREFRPSENGKQTPDPSPLADHPPLMGGPRHRSKPAVGMDTCYSATCLGAVPVRVNRVNCDPDSRCLSRNAEVYACHSENHAEKFAGVLSFKKRKNACLQLRNVCLRLQDSSRQPEKPC